MRGFTFLYLLSLACSSMGFSVLAPIQTTHRRSIGLSADPALSPACVTGRIASKSSSPNRLEQTKLHMSSTEKVQTTKKGTKVMDRIETKSEEKKNKEEMWRVVLHNDEVHTFNYVVRSLCKVIGTLDRKAAFEICVQTHGIGKATVTKTYKKQSEAHCLGLQRQGLTVSISPDEDFDGGHSGGGI